jgi:hypothetical protein
MWILQQRNSGSTCERDCGSYGNRGSVFKNFHVFGSAFERSGVYRFGRLESPITDSGRSSLRADLCDFSVAYTVTSGLSKPWSFSSHHEMQLFTETIRETKSCPPTPNMHVFVE